MRNPLASETSTNLGIFVARLALGASLLMAGYAQFSGGVGVFAASATSAGNLPRWMPGEASVAYSRCLPFIEMAAGGMLVLGLTTRVGGMLSAMMYGLILSARGLHFHPHADEHLPIYLALSILLLCLGGGSLTLDHLLFRKNVAPGPMGGQ